MTEYESRKRKKADTLKEYFEKTLKEYLPKKEREEFEKGKPEFAAAGVIRSTPSNSSSTGRASEHRIVTRNNTTISTRIEYNSKEGKIIVHKVKVNKKEEDEHKKEEDEVKVNKKEEDEQS